MSLITDIFKAITKISFYKTVKERGFARAFLHMLLLGAIYSIVIMVLASKLFLTEANLFLDWGKESLPTITFQDGKVSTDEREPYFVNYAPYELSFVFSTQAALEDTDSLAPNTVVIESDRVIYLDEEEAIEPFSLEDFMSNFPEGAILQSNSQTLEKFQKTLNLWFRPLIFLATFVTFLVGYFLFLFLLSIYGVIVSEVSKAKLRYSQILSIAAYSLTLLVVVLTVGQTIPAMQLPILTPLLFLLTLGYFTMGIVTNKVSDGAGQ